MSSLDGLEALVARRTWGEALEAGLSLWRRTRAGGLGQVVVAVGDLLDGEQRPLGGSAQQIVDAQLKLARTLRATELGRVLAASPIGNWADRHRLIAALVKWPADPRLGHHALKLARLFPRDGYSYFPPLSELLLSHGDGLILELAAERGSQFTKEERDDLADRLRPLTPTSAQDTKRLERLLRAVTPTRRGDLGELLAQVYARPADDALRAVYADALLEQGDPRGEFIQLQLRPKLTPAERARMKALLGKHEQTWSRPLNAVLEGRKYERGFLVEGELPGFWEEDPDLFPDSPVWSTLERVWFARPGIGPQFHRLEAMSGEPRQLAKGTFPSLQAFSAREASPSDWAPMLRGAQRLPKLTRLGLGKAPPALVASVLVSPLGRQLEWLSVLPDAKLVAYARPVLSSGLKGFSFGGTCALERVEDGWELHLVSPGNGRYERLTQMLGAVKPTALRRVRFIGSWHRFGPRNFVAAMKGHSLLPLVKKAAASFAE
jgi:uncharacterized protein (TIGR02996 family)